MKMFDCIWFVQAFKECKTCTFQRMEMEFKEANCCWNPFYLRFSPFFPIFYRCWFDLKLQWIKKKQWTKKVTHKTHHTLKTAEQKAIVKFGIELSVWVCAVHSAACAQHNASCQYNTKLILAAFIVWSAPCYYFISFPLWFYCALSPHIRASSKITFLNHFAWFSLT